VGERRASDSTTGAGTVVGIVGAGTMGGGIAQVALEAGHLVRMYDPATGAVERAIGRIADDLARKASRDMSAGDGGDASALLDRLAVAGSPAELAAGSALVIEAAVEDLAVKRTLFATLDRAAGPDTVLATNTSALSVGAIAAATGDPGRVVGLHFFNPAPRMALVEVVAPPARPAVASAAVDLMRAWGKAPVRCADTPGFIVNRVNRPFTLESLRIVEDGIATTADVDDALRSDGFPMGPFELMDLIGVDVNLAVARALYEAFDRDERFRPSPLQERLVAEGHLGRKSGQGFYRYEGSRRTDRAAGGRLDPDRAATIVERVTLAIANEAYRALGDGVAGRADIDLGLRLGAGHREGPFERVERLGGPSVARRSLERLALAVGPRFEPAPGLRDAG
jgi:3-hydroxybutyryl-CoA dehydrogenase